MNRTLRALALTVLLGLGVVTAQALPPPPAAREGFRALLMGDFAAPRGNYDPAVALTVRRAEGWGAALMLSAGNVVAAQSLQLNRSDVAALWAAYDRTVGLPLRRAGISTLISLGAGDASSATARGGQPLFPLSRAGAATYWRAHPPAGENGLTLLQRTEYPHRYTALYRPCAAQANCPEVFFAVLDANTPHADPAWLEAQLSSPAAQLAAMRVVIGHLPLHPVAAGRVPTLAQPERWRALMERYGVHTYIGGAQAAPLAARVGGLNVVFSGGIGGRDFLGHPGSGRAAALLLDFYPEQDLIRVHTVDARSGEVIPAGQLPGRVQTPGLTLERLSELRGR